MMNKPDANRCYTRRVWCKQGVLLFAGGGLCSSALGWQTTVGDTPPAVRCALMTDLHYADKPSAGSRYYRESLSKLSAAAEHLRQQTLDFVVELGDFIDAADSVDLELDYLEKINREFIPIHDQRHYVLGNHCVEQLTKAEFLGAVGQEHSYYSFDQGGVHFVVLDACFREDGEPYGRKNSHWTDANLSAAQLAWLQEDLASAVGPVVIFAHQRLDDAGRYSVRNATQARAIFEKSGQVCAVFQGHSHENSYQEIGGIHYCTLAAMIEGSGMKNSGFATLDVFRNGELRVTGLMRQVSYDWS